MTTAQQIALLKSNINSIIKIKDSFKNKFQLSDDLKFEDYPDAIYPPTQNDGVIFYKCHDIDFQPDIPGYNNIIISGADDPSNVNGKYINQTPALDINLCSFKHENGEFQIYKNNNCWYINYVSNNRETYDCLFSGSNFYTSDSGSRTNPYRWQTVKNSSDNTITKDFDVDSIGDSEFGSDFIYVKLKAGTEYQFGIIRNLEYIENEWDQYGDYISLYLYDGIPHQEYDDYIKYSSSSSTSTINGKSCTNKFTFVPEKDGYYRIAVGGQIYNVEGTYNYVCYPAPEQHVQLSLTEINFQNNEGSGNLTIDLDVVPEIKGKKEWSGYRVYPNVNENNETYYTFASVITTGLKYNNVQPTIGQICSSDANIKVSYMFDNTKYQNNQTILKHSFTDNNSKVYLIIYNTGTNNIVDWGDGQTTLLDQNNTNYSHTFTKAGNYNIKIKGNGVYYIELSINSSYQESQIDSKLTEVLKLSDYLSSLYRTFYYCRNLTTVHCQLPQSCTDFNLTFCGCTSLKSVPDTWLLPNNANYQHFMNGCQNVIANISNWFNNFKKYSHSNTRVDNLYRSFNYCYKLTGTVPADKFWEDYSWLNTSESVRESLETFTKCTLLSNYDKIGSKYK